MEDKDKELMKFTGQLAVTGIMLMFLPFLLIIVAIGTLILVAMMSDLPLMILFPIVGGSFLLIMKGLGK